MEKKKRKMVCVTKKKGKMVVVPEEALVKILSGSRLRSIARFRSVCKEWKSIIDSDMFRDLYVSQNSSSSSVSWSIMNNRNRTTLSSLEIVGHHGCKRWGLTNSLGSWITRYNPKTTVRKTCVLSCADGLVLLYSETSEGSPMYHIGNPLLQQWVRIPLPPHLSAFDVVRLQENKYFSDSGLVTKMEKGIVVGYKVVWMLALLKVSQTFTMMIYSSETGLWETSTVSCSRVLIWSRLKYSVPLNGILHWLASSGNDFDANYVVSNDLYKGGGHDKKCCIVPFPDQYETNRRFKRTITTSAGSVVYCNVFRDTIRVWRLVKYCNDDPISAWKRSWEINTNSLGFGTDYIPVVMHPLKSKIIYLWSRNKNGLVLLNLRTQKFSLHKEDEKKKKKSMDGCIMRLSGCKEYMDSIYSIYVNGGVGGVHNLYFSQLVLPRWLNPSP